MRSLVWFPRHHSSPYRRVLRFHHHSSQSRSNRYYPVHSFAPWNDGHRNGSHNANRSTELKMQGPMVTSLEAGSRNNFPNEVRVLSAASVLMVPIKNYCCYCNARWDASQDHRIEDTWPNNAQLRHLTSLQCCRRQSHFPNLLSFRQVLKPMLLLPNHRHSMRAAKSVVDENR